MENRNLKKYIKYGILGSLVFGIFGFLLMVLSAKNIVCCNFVNYTGCREGKKEE